jgi:hypothetical protein
MVPQLFDLKFPSPPFYSTSPYSYIFGARNVILGMISEDSINESVFNSGLSLHGYRNIPTKNGGDNDLLVTGTCIELEGKYTSRTLTNAIITHKEGKGVLFSIKNQNGKYEQYEEFAIKLVEEYTHADPYHRLTWALIISIFNGTQECRKIIEENDIQVIEVGCQLTPEDPEGKERKAWAQAGKRVIDLLKKIFAIHRMVCNNHNNTRYLIIELTNIQAINQSVISNYSNFQENHLFFFSKSSFNPSSVCPSFRLLLFSCNQRTVGAWRNYIH